MYEHSVEALAAAQVAYEEAVASNADTSTVLAALTTYSNLVTAAAARRAAAQEDNIKQLKAWCLENYENGADTMIECWGNEEYQELLDDCDGNLAEALDILRGLASVYADQQADARYHRNA